MNRAKRREYEKKYGKSFSMQKYREDIFAEGELVGRREALEIILYLTAYTINYKLGFGSKRLCDIMYHILDNIDAFRTEHLKPEDFKEIKRQINELGFNIK